MQRVMSCKKPAARSIYALCAGHAWYIYRHAISDALTAASRWTAATRVSFGRLFL